MNNRGTEDEIGAFRHGGACAQGEDALLIGRPGKRWILIAVRSFLGVLFFWAGLVKIMDPHAFAQTILNYRLVPSWTVNTLALVLPSLEVVVGTCLVLGRLLPGAVFMTNLLLLVFTSALLFNIARGVDVECGCFSRDVGGASNVSHLWPAVVRDLLLMSAALWVMWQEFESLRSAGNPSGDRKNPPSPVDNRCVRSRDR